MPQDKNKSQNSYVKNDSDSGVCIKTVISFLQLFIPVTTARKLVCVILIAAGMPVSRIAGLVGLSERSVQSTGRAVRDGSISSVSPTRKPADVKAKWSMWKAGSLQN